jgi:hypothetical protein
VQSRSGFGYSTIASGLGLHTPAWVEERGHDSDYRRHRSNLAETAPCARPTASASIGSVSSMRVLTTCSALAPASLRAVRMVSRHRCAGEDAVRDALKRALVAIGVADRENIDFHSFRRSQIADL